ncbi:MAG: DUF721 domain-containing protein [Bacteroidales bacterium]|jgi:hypothetical protein|nr:DUF721 domain-containing protein [Bacteroidales bacterium]
MQAIGGFIQHFFEKNGKSSLFLEHQAIELWEKVAGDFIAKQTTKITAKYGVLYVTIPNAALRFEVFINRTQIVAKINETLNSDIIKGIIVN